jgi:hypothetical protein
VTKLPSPPAPAILAAINPVVLTLPAGAPLARIFFQGGAHPVSWDTFRHWGPTQSRFDHHLLSPFGQPHAQARGILYAASASPPGALAICAAEVFQATRIVNRAADAPWFAVFRTARPVRLVDLTGAFATRTGASALISSGPKARSRRWAQAIYTAWPHLDGIAYRASMGGSAPAFALTERAILALPATPTMQRALTDPALQSRLLKAAADIGYGVI